MKRLGAVFITLFVVLFSSIVLADTEYQAPSGEDYTYQTGIGYFTDRTDFSYYTKAINVQRNMPLVADLDNDGINEIVVLDNIKFKLFTAVPLTEIKSYTSANQSGYPYFILYDIDNDNLTEIITASSGSNAIDIIEYNGTHIYNQNSFTYTNHTDGEIMLACKGTDDCIIIYTETVVSDGNAPTEPVWSMAFSSTATGSVTQLYQHLAERGVMCFPRIPVISVTDYDADGTTEYIYSALGVHSQNANDRLIIQSLDVTALSISVELNLTDMNALDCGVLNCPQNWEQESSSADPRDCDSVIGLTHAYGDAVSSPLVTNIDTTDELEIIIGYMVDSDEYNMISMDYLGNGIDNYPETWDADGILISNPVKANAFEGSGNVDFCVMGYRESNQEIDFVCGSEQDTWSGGETVEFLLDISDLWNISYDFGVWNVMTHSVDQRNVLGEGTALSELLTSYGVLEMDWDTNCRIEAPVLKCLNIIFDNPVETDGILMSVDVQQTNYPDGREDLLLLTSSNIYYIDDNFVNSPAQIVGYTTNPCILDDNDNPVTWKENTTVVVTVTVEDIDGNLVNARAVLYDQDTNEQDDGWSENRSSGAEISFTYIANKTISAGTLKMYGRDTENPDNPDTITVPFQVAISGIEFGDCTTTWEQEEGAELVGNACISDDECGTGSCIGNVCVAEEETLPQRAMEEASSVFRMGKTVLWLMFMMGLAIGFWFAPISKKESFLDSANARFGAIIIGETFLLILGTMFGFLPLAIIITILILALIGFSIWVVRQFTGVGRSVK